MTLEVVSDAAGRMRVKVDWVRCDSRRAVAVEEAVAKQNGVRVVHAYPRTGSVVVWYSPRERCQHSLLAGEFAAGIHALRRGFIGGLVGPGLGAAEVAIEYVVGGDVD